MSQIKEILAAKENELQDMQRKEVKVGDEYSFMLTRLGGKYYATSGKCTHYGAPLVGAALASDGRLMCKWHGACFNVKTGDVEDAPALDSLQTYDVKIRDGNVYVLVDDERLSSFRRHPACARRSPRSNQTVVIIGGGASGSAAAQKLREEGFQGRIRIVSREAYYPVDRIKITKQYGIESPDAITLRPKEFWDDLDIEFQLDTDATLVDAHARKVKLSNGDEWEYNYLILASGGWPKTMGWSGENLQNIFTIRMVGDNTKIYQTLKKLKKEKGRQPRVVVVGSSFIGTEIASAIVQNKAAEVTIVSVDKLPLQKVLGDEIGKVIMRIHDSKGVKFITEAQVLGFEHDADDLSTVGYVVIKDRAPVPADLVIIAVGVRPQTDYLKDNAELARADDGSLVVDRYFRVVGSDDVYATGDIATFPYQHTGEQLRIEHWGFAENTGRLVAMNIAKGPLARPFSHVPYFWTAQFGTTLRYAGFAKSFDRVVVQGNTTDLENLSFVGYFAKNDEVLAICSYMKDPYTSYCAELLRLGKMPKASEISNGLDPMSIPLIVPEEEELQARM